MELPFAQTTAISETETYVYRIINISCGGPVLLVVKSIRPQFQLEAKKIKLNVSSSSSSTRQGRFPRLIHCLQPCSPPGSNKQRASSPTLESRNPHTSNLFSPNPPILKIHARISLITFPTIGTSAASIGPTSIRFLTVLFVPLKAL